MEIRSQFGLTVYGGPKFKTPYYFREDTKKPFVFTSFFPNIKIPFDEIQSKSGNRHIIEVFDSSNDNLIWKLPIDFKLYSQYKPKDKEFELTPVYYLDSKNKLLYLSFDNSLTIGIYGLDLDFDMKRQITLEKNELFDKGKGKTVKLFPVFDHGFLILRYSGMSELELARKKELNAMYSPIQDTQLYRFCYTYGENAFFKELLFPDGIEPNSELLNLGGGKILMREKDREDSEITHSMYSVFKLRKKEL
ncbi:hypothetical protein A3SI_12099 [Nitritalea halalkaliphila LW7]|uniref:Uncharacterized protein n=1 Tax=Nitritalea halalkaliphila LW7 TaxID=1189621 RepID=I5C1U3_9BACT|nr:hypothetical protein [Nitritalea halalkaliphila]EIM75795.1 hypothetical protein A3SI_12099 [Nitritalea halalkaliphila LW7]